MKFVKQSENERHHDFGTPGKNGLMTLEFLQKITYYRGNVITRMETICQWISMENYQKVVRDWLNKSCKLRLEG